MVGSPVTFLGSASPNAAPAAVLISADTDNDPDVDVHLNWSLPVTAAHFTGACFTVTEHPGAAVVTILQEAPDRIRVTFDEAIDREDTVNFVISNASATAPQSVAIDA